MKLLSLLRVISLAPTLSYHVTKTRVKFTGSCLKQDKITHTHGKTVKIYIVYELTASSSNSYDWPYP